MVAFAPDDQTILTATEDGEIRLWDAKSGAPRGRSSDHIRKSLLTGALGPEGRWLATAGKDWSVRIWDAASLKLDSRAASSRPGACVRLWPWRPDSSHGQHR